MLYAIALQREQVYITNVLKCRPPANRQPQITEVQSCAHFLQQQIKLIKPKLILALGKVAAHFLLNTDVALTKLRGSIYTYSISNIPILVTYHPAYLLRNTQAKSAAYADLQLVAQYLQVSSSDT